MSVRFLISGLAVLAGLVALAAFPVLAQGHTPNTDKPCTIKGTSHGDYLQGSGANDVICGYGGDDVISGSAGNDIIKGGAGDDTL